MKKFTMDSRNVGGLKQMSDQMYKHHKALIDVKPAISIKPPKPHVDSKKKVVDLPMYKNKKEFDNVLKTFQTVITMKKGLIDTNAPVSMEMRKQITGNNSKQEKHEYNEHVLRMQSQQRRIQSATSMKERMKNQFDPIAHPPRFFRREGQSVANVKVDKLLAHFVKEHRNMEESIDSKLTNRPRQLPSKKNRPQSAAPQQQPEKEVKLEEITTFVEIIPKVEGSNREAYEELKKLLIKCIFKHRIYKTDDLESLFGRVLIHNPQLDLALAEGMFQEIRDEFQE